MPNRILKESICYSDDLDRLTAFEETVFYRLIVRADDYGRLDARPGFLKSMLFVTKQGVTEKNVGEAVSKLASIGLVRLYEVDGKPFLLFPKWDLHQRVRNSRKKYPDPPETDSGGSPQLAASCGGPPPHARVYENPNPNPNPNPKESTPAQRKAHGEYGWVKLTEEEFERLRSELGEAELNRCITYIDESAQASGNKNHWRDWKLVLRRCHRDGWGLRGPKAPQSGGLKEADLEELERLSMAELMRGPAG